MPVVSLIIPIRNRDPDRLEKSILSVIDSTSVAFEGIVSDFGSSLEYSENYGAICSRHHFRLIRSESQGLPWSRSRAVNIGVRSSSSQYLALSDADILYRSDTLSYCVNNASERTALQIEPLWMSEKMDERSAVSTGRGHFGLQFVPKEAFQELGGLDERMMYWGLEDIDWVNRLQSVGFVLEWIPQTYRVLHMWHAAGFADRFRPRTSLFDSMGAVLENLASPRLSQEWGRPMLREDRPILKVVGDPAVAKIQVPVSGLGTRWKEVANVLQSDHVLCLQLGERIARRKLSFLAQPLLRALSGIANKSGLGFTEQINDNFDLIYASLPILRERYSLVDYFIESDLGTIWLQST